MVSILHPVALNNILIIYSFRLAEMMYNLLEISLAPSIPTSLCNIPTKYIIIIIIRLWTLGFQKLESLCCMSFLSPLALEYLQDFIYYVYTFYTGILKEQILCPFRAGWLKALGDLVHYRMAVAVLRNSPQPSPQSYPVNTPTSPYNHLQHLTNHPICP